MLSKAEILALAHIREMLDCPQCRSIRVYGAVFQNKLYCFDCNWEVLLSKRKFQEFIGSILHDYGAASDLAQSAREGEI